MENLGEALKLLDERFDPSTPTATNQIYNYIASIHPERKENVNRCSSAPHCVRRRWYANHGYQGTPLTPRKYINYMAGHIAEMTMVCWIKEACVGDGKVYKQVITGDKIADLKIGDHIITQYTQPEWHLKVDSLDITGHPDGVGQLQDGTWELIEMKSSNSYSFDEFKKGVTEYLPQVHALMLTDEAKTLDIKRVRFFYLCKQTGTIWDCCYKYDDSIAQKVVEDFKAAVADEIPERPFSLEIETYYKKPTGFLKPPWQCGYCPFMEQCHGKPDSFEVKNGKPVFRWKRQLEESFI